MVDFDTLMAMSPEERAAFDEELAARALARAERTRAQSETHSEAGGATTGEEQSFAKRSDVEAAIRRGAGELAKREGLNSEVAIAKFARTDEGQRLKKLYDELSDDRSEPALPVRKVGPGGTGEIAKAARKIASERGISEEAAYAHLPAEILERHRDELEA